MPPVSKIAQLPDEIRNWLRKTLVERAFGDIVDVTNELNAMLKEAGVAVYVGKSAVGAESQKVKRAQEAIKATTEACRLIHEASPDDAAFRSMGVMAMIEEGMFTAIMDLREAENEPDPDVRLGMMTKAAQGFAKLAAARVIQAKWQGDVEARCKAAADKVGKLAKKGGLTPAQIAEIRESILGIKKKAE